MNIPFSKVFDTTDMAINKRKGEKGEINSWKVKFQFSVIFQILSKSNAELLFSIMNSNYCFGISLENQNL